MYSNQISTNWKERAIQVVSRRVRIASPTSTKHRSYRILPSLKFLLPALINSSLSATREKQGNQNWVFQFIAPYTSSEYLSGLKVYRLIRIPACNRERLLFLQSTHSP